MIFGLQRYVSRGLYLDIFHVACVAMEYLVLLESLSGTVIRILEPGCEFSDYVCV